MKTRTPVTLVLAVAFFASCSKSSTPTPPPPSGDTTKPSPYMDVSLSYPMSAQNGKFELIISEPSGKILLDTIAPQSWPVVARLKTSDTLLDVTSVYDYGIVQGVPYRYWVNVLKSVNPSRFTNTYLMSPPSIALYNIGGSSAHLFCKNLPASLPDANAAADVDFFNGYASGVGTRFFNTTERTLQFDYARNPGAYSYFSLPSLGLYKLYVPGSDADTIDCSQLDNAINYTFTRLFPFTIDYTRSTLIGYPDTTKPNTAIRLGYDIYAIAPAHGDLMLPQTPMQRFDYSLAAKNSQGDALNSYFSGSSLPATPNFPDASAFNMQSTQPDNIAVSFNASSTVTTCRTLLFNSSFVLDIQTARDSTNLHPESFITNLKPQLLSGVTTNDLALSSFSAYSVPGYSYSSYVVYMAALMGGPKPAGSMNSFGWLNRVFKPIQ